MNPLSIHKELVLVLSFWQVQDGYKVIVAEDTEWHIIIRLQNKRLLILKMTAWYVYLQSLIQAFKIFGQDVNIKVIIDPVHLHSQIPHNVSLQSRVLCKPCKNHRSLHLLLRGILVPQLLKEPAMKTSLPPPAQRMTVGLAWGPVFTRSSRSGAVNSFSPDTWWGNKQRPSHVPSIRSTRPIPSPKNCSHCLWEWAVEEDI